MMALERSQIDYQLPIRLQWLVHEVKRPVDTDPDGEYNELGIRLYGKGTFHKPTTTGEALGSKKVYRVKRGDLLLNIIFACEGAVAIADEEDDGFVVSFRFPTYRVDESVVDARYLKYFLLSQRGLALLKKHSPGSAGSNKTLNRERLFKEKIRLPPLAVQVKLVDELESRLNAILSVQTQCENLLEFLDEWLLARIDAAATGATSDGNRKQTSIEWLPEVPLDWDIVEFRRVLQKIEQGWSPTAHDRERQPNEWGVLKLSAVSDWKFIPEEFKVLDSDLEPRPELAVKDGDVLITRANTPELVARTCYVNRAPDRVMLSDLIYRVKPSRRLNPEYLSRWFQSQSARQQIRRDARGSSSTMVKVSQEHIRSWTVAVPPKGEQAAICQQLARDVKRVESCKEILQKKLILLEELRATLIDWIFSTRTSDSTTNREG